MRSAVEIRRVLASRNADLPEERKMLFRIGIHLGDIRVEGEQIFGDGVNIAARLEGLAEPGGICISSTVHEHPRAFPAYRPLLEQSPAARMVADLWGARDVWFMYEQVFLKEGPQTRRTPWHQDASYLPVDGEMLAVIWIPFEALSAEDSLELVRGSHRQVLHDGSRFDPADDTAPLYGDGSLPRLPDIEANRSQWDIVSWPVEPGDVVVFHPKTLHGGAATRSGARRRTLSLRFFGEDAVYAPRSSPPRGRRPDVAADAEASVFTKLPDTLRPGDPFRHPGFHKL